jgi:hypothetical protein
MSYDADSTQASLLYSASGIQSAGSVLTLKDSNGDTLLTYTAPKQFNAIAYSSPKLTVGDTYTFAVNGSTLTTFTLSQQCAQVSSDGTVSSYNGAEMGGPGMGAGDAPGGNAPGADGGNVLESGDGGGPGAGVSATGESSATGPGMAPGPTDNAS